MLHKGKFWDNRGVYVYSLEPAHGETDTQQITDLRGKEQKYKEGSDELNSIPCAILLI